MSPSMSDRLKSVFATPQRLFIAPGGEEFAAWCREHPGTAVELLVSARALHELVCEPGLPLVDRAAVKAYAQQQFAHYFGAPAQRFEMAPWQLGDAAGASALHGIELAALQAQADAAGVRLHAVRPAWAVWLSALPASLRAGSGRLAWREGELAVLIELERGRVVSVQVRRSLPPGEALLAEGTPESDLAPQPGPAMPQPDFLNRVVRSALAWPLAAVGAVVFAAAFWSAGQSHLAAQEALAQRDRVAALRSTAPPSSAGKAAADPENRSAREAQTLLRAPWEATLSRVESAGAAAKGIDWLGLDASAARGELRLDGLTPDKLLALQLAESLGSTPGWAQVVLTRFSQAEPGLTGQRFEISARLAGGGT